MAIHPMGPAAHQTLAASSDISRRWVALLEAGDIEGALSLYSPAARVHTGTVTFVGYQGVRLYLGQLRLTGWSPPRVEFHATGNSQVILWRPASPGCLDTQPAMTRLRISNGRIVEQWVGGDASSQPLMNSSIATGAADSP